MFRSQTAVIAALLLAACAPAATRSADAIRDPESLIMAMRERYHGQGFRTVVLDQRTTLRRGDEAVVETWRKYLSAPGHLRIETDPSRANGVIKTRDSVFVVRDRRLATKAEDYDARMTVAFDVYVQDTRETLDDLKELGFLPGTVRTAEWEGEPAYVLSANDTAGRTHQVWIEARRLVPVRLVQPAEGGRTMEIRFEDYRLLHQWWLAERVEVSVDGEPVQLEEYANVRTGVPLPRTVFEAGLWNWAFDLNPFSRAHHVDASDPSPSRHGRPTRPSGTLRTYDGWRQVF
ncbi:MAG TPA: hypothetical protein VF092_09840 [Longimicrobium sp.]